MMSDNITKLNKLEIDKAWAIEVENRDEQLNNGTAKLISGKDVFNKIKNQYLKC